MVVHRSLARGSGRAAARAASGHDRAPDHDHPPRPRRRPRHAALPPRVPPAAQRRRGVPPRAQGGPGAARGPAARSAPARGRRRRRRPRAPRGRRPGGRGRVRGRARRVPAPADGGGPVARGGGGHGGRGHRLARGPALLPGVLRLVLPTGGVPVPPPAEVPAVAELVGALGRYPPPGREAVDLLPAPDAGWCHGVAAALDAVPGRARARPAAVRAWARLLAPDPHGRRRGGHRSPRTSSRPPSPGCATSRCATRSSPGRRPACCRASSSTPGGGAAGAAPAPVGRDGDVAA